MAPAYHAQFPATRLRRLRRTPWLREMVAETRLCPSDLILPLFIQEGNAEQTAIASMPGVYRLTLDLAIQTAKQAASLGIPAIALFPSVAPAKKSEDAKEAWNSDNLICRAVKAIKDSVPEIGIICDVALDPYTTHGHDGLVLSGDVANDATLEALCKQARVQALAGCDILAPSDMMDGRIGAIRAALDADKLTHVCLLSYAVKYASAFYGPFRDAVGSKANLGTSGKQTYQMDPRNSEESLREVALDIAEGADMVMVKPGLPYLDIIRLVKETFPVPVLAYQVSGEYAMLKAAEANGWLDQRAMMESLVSLKRGGASAIVTYAALEVAESLSS